MRTGFRGTGCYKRELYDALRQRFEQHIFSYSDAEGLDEFERPAFCSLAEGGYLKKYRHGVKCLYKISEPESSHQRKKSDKATLTYMPCSGTKLLTNPAPDGGYE